MSSSDLPGMTRREFLKATAYISSMPLSSGGASAAAASGSKPNILYLMTDQHRSDCLGCAGNHIIKTPNLDSIAADGVLFSNAYTSTPSCTPARSAILTGLSPWRQRMVAHLSERGREFVEDGTLTIRKKRLLYSPNYPGRNGQ